MTATRRAGSLTQCLINSTAQTITVTVPSAAVVGDIAIISLYTNGTAYKSATASGWTKLGEMDGSLTTNLVVFWKTIAAGDPGASVTIGTVSTQISNNYIVASVEVWSGSLAPTATFNRATGTTPAVATVPVGSIPLCVMVLYDASSNAPSSVTPPSGYSGQYLVASSPTPTRGLGAWYGSAPTGTSVASARFDSSNTATLAATIVLAPSVTNNAYIAGSTSASDVLCSVILAGASAGADTTLLWTP